MDGLSELCAQRDELTARIDKLQHELDSINREIAQTRDEIARARAAGSPQIPIYLYTPPMSHGELMDSILHAQYQASEAWLRASYPTAFYPAQDPS